MFVRHAVSVEPGDIFSASRQTQRGFFQTLFLAKSRKSHAPENGSEYFGDCFGDYWRVVELLTFNDLPHARLTHCRTGRDRIIALDALAQGNIYRKKQRHA